MKLIKKTLWRIAYTVIVCDCLALYRIKDLIRIWHHSDCAYKLGGRHEKAQNRAYDDLRFLR